MRARWFGVAVAALFFGSIVRGAAAPAGYADYRRTVFVAGRDSTSLVAIDIDTNVVTDRLDLGLVPRDMQISQSGGWLVASDRQNARLVILNLAESSVRSVALSLVPTRLRISADGAIVAALDDAHGGIAVIDLGLGRETARIEGPAAIRDAIFSTDGKSLFVAADTVDGIAVYDLASAGRTTVIAAPPAIALIRAPNGRDGFALTAGPGRSILQIDLRSRVLLAQLPAPNATALFPTRSGSHLMVLDSRGGALSIVPAQPLERSVALAAVPGISAAYGAWFDTVAFVPDRAQRKLLVYDLDRRNQGAAIALLGSPGTGVVTPDGDRLYLPIEDTSEVVVIDAQQRRAIASIAVGGIPVQAVIAGGYGLCH